MDSQDSSRRQWLTSVVRGGFASLIATVAAWLIWRSRGVRCSQPALCARCGSLSGCRLPAAVAWKQRP